MSPELHTVLFPSQLLPSVTIWTTGVRTAAAGGMSGARCEEGSTTDVAVGNSRTLSTLWACGRTTGAAAGADGVDGDFFAGTDFGFASFGLGFTRGGFFTLTEDFFFAAILFM